MSDVFDKTVAILLASGLSRRFKRKDKLLQDLGGKPLFEHMASRLAAFEFPARIAVCPPRSHDLRDQLDGRFIIAPNVSPESGLGVSISVGVRVAMQFRPEYVLLVLADMPFVESASIARLISTAEADPGLDIIHSGRGDAVRPPSLFQQRCFEPLQVLKGDSGAGSLVGRPGFRSVGLSVAEPELLDVDTAFDLDTARAQWAVRKRCLGSTTAEMV